MILNIRLLMINDNLILYLLDNMIKFRMRNSNNIIKYLLKIMIINGYSII